MENEESKLIYERNVKLSDKAILNLKAIGIKVDDKDDYRYDTYGTVIYNNGESIVLDPVKSSDYECYLWKKGRIYTYLKNNTFSSKVFNIKDRCYKNISINSKTKNSLLNSSSFDNTSIQFYRVEELAHGNKLLINRFYNVMDLIDTHIFINNKGEMYYLGGRIVCSPKQELEGIVWDENYVYYYIKPHNDIIVTCVYDISNDKPERCYKMEDEYKQKVKHLIKQY